MLLSFSLSFYADFIDDPSLAKTSFDSLSEARQSLLSITLYSLKDAASRTKEQLHLYHQRFDAWSTSFEGFVAKFKSTPMSDVDRRGLALLELYKQFLALGLVHGYRQDEWSELTWDQHNAEFEEMVNSATIAAGTEDEKTSLSTARSVFHMDIGLLPVLFSIVARCRDPLLRRRAIDLMYSGHTLEGVWDGFLTGKVARRLVELEESVAVVKCNADIPLEVRISTVKFAVGTSERMAIIGFERHDRSLIWETIEW